VVNYRAPTLFIRTRYAIAAVLVTGCGTSAGSAPDAGASAVDARSSGVDATPAEPPQIIYDGYGPSQFEPMFADWDGANPRPFLVLEDLVSGEAWVHISLGFAVTPDGALWRQLGGLNTHVVVWAWADEQPALLAAGVAPVLPGWNPETPYPLLVLAEIDTDTWNIYSAVVNPDGSVDTAPGLDKRVFGWPSSGPALVVDQTNADWDTPPVRIPGWDDTAPVPIVLMRTEDGATWRVSDTDIEDDGKVKSAPGRTLVWTW
jgi:hypothetical protein